MPVTSTPVTPPSPTDLTCAGQSTVEPKVSTVEGRQVLARMQSVQVAQGQAAEILWTFRNPDGNPLDLSTCGPTYNIKLRIREAVNNLTTEPVVEITGSVVDEATGRIKATLTNAVVRCPGIFIAEFAIIKPTDVTHSTDVFYLAVNPGQFGATDCCSRQPSISEIRLHLRDSASEDNTLLESTEFDLAEIALAIRRPVDYWNEAAPPIEVYYSTQNFPFRYHWLEAIVGELLVMAAHHYRRNHLAYTAAGVAVDDKNKFAMYEEAGLRRIVDFRRFVTQKKVAMNMAAGFADFGSVYSSL